MILVDTSVLIPFLRGIENEKTRKFEELIEKNIPFGINNYIYQEVLQGARNEREFRVLEEYLSSQIFYELEHGRKSYRKAAFLYFRCRKAGFTIRSTIDLLIAQTAIENGLYLLHNDQDFAIIARVENKLMEW
ncbi:MAG: PIN domain nuclease [Candidatus Atribacteria bacterium]|nr:PIN domain nuclease [Candidatus Atribacteria bacterium]